MTAGKGTVLGVLHAGFGNRLFQAAAAFAHARRTGRSLALVEVPNWEHGFRSYDDVFSRFPVVAPPPERPNIEASDDAQTFLQRRPLPDAPAGADVCLRGYWQNEAYFADAAAELRALLSPAPERAVGAMCKLPSWLFDRMIAVHVRLGDAMQHAQLKFIYGTDYYDRAMAVAEAAFRARHNGREPWFVLVSDEPHRVGDVFPRVAARCAPYPLITDDDVAALYFMARCAGVVSGNSTFGWWGAWLNARPDKVVVLPTPWAADLPGATLSMDGAIEVKTTPPPSKP